MFENGIGIAFGRSEVRNESYFRPAAASNGPAEIARRRIAEGGMMGGRIEHNVGTNHLIRKKRRRNEPRPTPVSRTSSQSLGRGDGSLFATVENALSNLW
jgi:hypothetical protein